MNDNEKLELLKECEYNVIVSDLIETVKALCIQIEDPKIKFEYIRQYLEDKDKYNSELIWRKRFNDIMAVTIEELDIDEFTLVLGENTMKIFLNFLNLDNSYCRFLKVNLDFIQNGDYYLIITKDELNKFNRYRYLEENVFEQLHDFIEKQIEDDDKENVVQIWYKKGDEIKCVKNNCPSKDLFDTVINTRLF